MSETRVHLEAILAEGATLDLPEGPFRHLVQVLRMQAGDTLVVFDGRGGEYEATLESVGKRAATVRVGAFRDVSRESTLQLTLVQGISKGDRMDWTLQKAVELGVTCIVPIITERCNVHLGSERQDRKFDHWQGVIVSACEQSGRTRVPVLAPVQRLADWLGTPAAGERLMLDPLAESPLTQAAGPAAPLSLVVGPEGGLSAAELALGERHGCRGVRLGPRVLRTETAGVAALAAVQALWGDLGR
jgi:16S rRNA (uracil1498-N3)-methyltransferase